MTLSRRVRRGLLAGAAGTAAHSVVMITSQRLGLFGRQPPEILAAGAEEAVLGERPPAPVVDATAMAGHLGYGVGLGVVFELLPGRRRLAIAVGFGLAVWALSYLVAAPALRLYPKPADDSPGRQAGLIAAHIAYGMGLGLAARAAR